MSRHTQRAAVLMVILLVILIPLAITQFNQRVDLSGAAILTKPEQDTDAEPVPPDPPAQEPPAPPPPPEPPPAEPPPAEPPPQEPPPTEVPPTVVPPTEVVPTVVPPTATPAPTEEETPEVKDAAAAFMLTAACTGQGVQFVISNTGADMGQPLPYLIDGEARGTAQLQAGESLTLTAGYDAPVLTFAGQTVQAAEPCAPPLELTGSAECQLADGVLFTIVNAGSAMPSAQEYSVQYAAGEGESFAGSFQLDAGETVEVRAGYGQPWLLAGDLVVESPERCYAPGRVMGSIWHDADGDQLYDETVESGFPDVVAVLINEAGEAVEARTQINGRYQFEMLQPGSYVIQIRLETLPEDMEASYDPDGGADSAAVIPVSAGETTTANFGYEPVRLAAISGVVWQDTNGDGTYEAAEAGLGGVVVALAGADGTTREATTLEDGRYQFSEVKPGHYSLQINTETLPEDMEASYDPDGGADSAAVMQVAAEETISANFGYEPAGTAAIGGVVWLELRNFGGLDAGEPGMPGIVVELVDVTGVVLDVSRTNEQGFYWFDGLRAGSYQVRLDGKTLPQPFGITFNADATYDLQTTVTVETGQELRNTHFGIVGTF